MKNRHDQKCIIDEKGIKLRVDWKEILVKKGQNAKTVVIKGNRNKLK
jgi:hypothetical protein